MDVNLCYGITPMEHRERYREAVALTLKAWQAREIFSWNGRYFQLATVNLWPRPIQQPHPPVWVPGSGSISTFDFAVEHDVCYCFLSYSGARSAKTMMDGYWRVVAEKGRDLNPYRAGFLQLVVVAENDARAEEKYARHVEYFYHKCLHVPAMWFSPPGNQDYRSLVATMSNPVRRAENPKNLRYRDFVEKGFVIAGSPATVRDRLKEEVIKSLRVGNLMVLLQIGSMPHELALENIELFGREVLPGLRGIWDDEGWVNHWWPERHMSVRVEAPAAAGAEERIITVWQGRVRMRVVSKGRGPALVFFHGPWGLTWDPFLDQLAESFTVYAPDHPGTTPEAHDDIYHLDGLWDLVLCYDELLETLGVRNAAFVGHSFGGMVACEVAASYPDRVRRLAMIAPLGFWRDPDRIVNWMMLEPGALRAHIFRDPDGDAARRMFPRSDAQDAAATAARVRLMWAMGTTGKFIWPIPDKGLKKRIHRVKAPTMLVWGREDRLVPAVYADEFTRRIPGARVQMIDSAGHAPHLEQTTPVVGVLRDFLAQ